MEFIKSRGPASKGAGVWASQYQNTIRIPAPAASTAEIAELKSLLVGFMEYGRHSAEYKTDKKAGHLHLPV